MMIILKNKKFILLLLFSLLIISIVFLVVCFGNFNFLKNGKYAGINLYFSPVNPLINTITADSSNRLALMVEARNKHGNPVSGVLIKFNSYNNTGIFYPETVRTNEFGEAFVSYIPPDIIDIKAVSFIQDEVYANEIDSSNSTGNAAGNSGNSVLNFIGNSNNTNSEKSAMAEISLTAEVIRIKNIKSSISFKLIPVPIILVHGYQSTGEIFINMADYFNSVGLEPLSINYDSSKGVLSAADELKDFLIEQKSLYLSKGIQIGKFDMVCHSMGGIVARYYTCSEDYIAYNNVRKIIFISVPHKGSHLAPIGAKYFEDQGVKDMMPESSLFVDIFPHMNNGGLNSTIQTGNIIGQFDEVVSPESGILNDWGIDTYVFNLGNSNFSVDSFTDGDISKSAIHRVILNNRKVFEKVVEMLNKNLPYPVFWESNLRKNIIKNVKYKELCTSVWITLWFY